MTSRATKIMHNKWVKSVVFGSYEVFLINLGLKVETKV